MVKLQSVAIPRDKIWGRLVNTRTIQSINTIAAKCQNNPAIKMITKIEQQIKSADQIKQYLRKIDSIYCDSKTAKEKKKGKFLNKCHASKRQITTQINLDYKNTKIEWRKIQIKLTLDSNNKRRAIKYYPEINH